MRNIFLIILLSFLTVEVIAQESVYDIIKTDSCPGAEVVGEPELYVGDDLFDLINGGAEIYHEYGFVEVLAAEMKLPGGDTVKVEIYDMGSTDAAWGIYTVTRNWFFSTPFFAPGYGRHTDGYAQWIRGQYMIYMYYGDIPDDELQLLGSCMARNIIERGQQPRIMWLLYDLGDKIKDLRYFKGNLGLSTLYNFHYKDVFGYQDGAAAIFPDVTIFLLDYKDEGLCIEGYNDAKDFFMQSTKYHDQISLRGSFHMKDRKEQQIDCYFENTFLIIFISSGDIELNEAREEIVNQMNN